jgi:predicted dehydrogenase
MNYAVVGVGGWGYNHARVGAELREAGVVDRLVVCDVDPERCRAVAAEFDAEMATDPADLPGMGVDAATVATPTPSHGSVARGLLDAGIATLVEKPLAADVATAWDLVAAAERAGTTLAVGHVFRYHPALNELRDRVRAGDLGEVTHLATERFAFRPPRATTGALFSLAVHDVDAYAYLLDRDPDSVYCRLGRSARGDVDDTAALTLGYGEATGTVEASWLVPVHGKRRHLTVVGTEGAAAIDYLDTTRLDLWDTRIEGPPDALRAVGGGPETVHAPDVEPLRAEVTEFLAAVRGETTCRSPGTVGARAVELLELAVRSDAEGRVVTEVPPPAGRWRAGGPGSALTDGSDEAAETDGGDAPDPA